MPTVLVTGAARGIGKSIVEHLVATGWDVIAGVRSEADAAAVTAIEPQRVSAVILDVTKAEDIAALAESLPVKLDAVVNNAGIVVAGPVEAVTPEQWRKQLEVNVIGQLAVTTAVLPRLRATRGRVVFISSVSGRVSTPLTGAYSASKFALEGAADALRVELRSWGVRVILVEPSQTDTDMWRTADTLAAETEDAMSPEHRGLYAKHIAGLRTNIPRLQKMAVPVELVAAAVGEALTAPRPHARYIVGFGPKVQVAVMSALPTRLRDLVIGTVSRVPRRP